jgi:hypothetical protein
MPPARCLKISSKSQHAFGVPNHQRPIIASRGFGMHLVVEILADLVIQFVDELTALPLARKLVWIGAAIAIIRANLTGIAISPVAATYTAKRCTSVITWTKTRSWSALERAAAAISAGHSAPTVAACDRCRGRRTYGYACRRSKRDRGNLNERDRQNCEPAGDN